MTKKTVMMRVTPEAKKKIKFLAFKKGMTIVQYVDTHVVGLKTKVNPLSTVSLTKK